MVSNEKDLNAINDAICVTVDLKKHRSTFGENFDGGKIKENDTFVRCFINVRSSLMFFSSCKSPLSEKQSLRLN